MKLKKMAGALALTAALAMGTAPAFAAETAVGNNHDFKDGATWGTSNEAAATSDTVVKAFAFNEQLNATIPLEITIVFPSTGGAIISPDKTAYKITNNSTKADIKVVEAELSGANMNFQWRNTIPTGGMNQAADTTSKNQILFKIEAGGANTPLQPAGSQGAINGLKLSGATDGDNYFNVPKNDSTGIKISGEVGVPPTAPLGTGLMADTLTKINYTITAIA